MLWMLPSQAFLRNCYQYINNGEQSCTVYAFDILTRVERLCYIELDSYCTTFTPFTILLGLTGGVVLDIDSCQI